MNLKQVAQLIPVEYRDMILEGNVIVKAIAIPSDKDMFMLFTIWKNFVNPSANLKPDCTKCLGEILANYKRLQPILLQLRLDDQKINA